MCPDFIQMLISQDKRLEAIRFIYAFEMVDKFPPVPLLKAHLKLAKKIAMSWKGKNNIKAQVFLPFFFLFTNTLINGIKLLFPYTIFIKLLTG
jgi:hypothetical protein